MLKRPTLFEMVMQRLLRRYLVRYGPVMVHARWAGHWWFIDLEGVVWKVEATHHYDGSCPLRISKQLEP